MALHRTPALAVLAAALLATSSSGCKYEEGLIINNMQGTIVVPRAAATKSYADGNGGTYEVTDVRNIGPIYVGLFPDVENADVIASYPHPAVGPIFQEDTQGDTYPYGGTTVGDVRFGCFAALTCRITSGRWDSYQSIVDWFNDTVGYQISDADGRPVTDGEYFRQTCFDLMEVTSDQEVMLLPEDQDGNDKIDMADLDFVENADGDFEATFTLWQQDHFWDRDAQEKNDCEPGIDCPAYKLWAFMDGPGNGGQLATCDQSNNLGFEVEEYTADFFGGRAFPDILNQPDSYISGGDWVSDAYLDGGEFVVGAYEWQNVFDRPTIRIGHEVTQ